MRYEREDRSWLERLPVSPSQSRGDDKHGTLICRH